ncbi:MAG: hypothetical protein AAGD92_17190, partial [Pseudomonadota bacterium]
MDRGLPSPSETRPESPPSSADQGSAYRDDTLEPLELDVGAILPPADYADDPAEDAEIETGRSEISALVERIAEFRRTREAQDGSDPADLDRSPRLPLDEAEAPRVKRSTGFAFASDVASRIEWTDSEVAPMIVGKRLIRTRALTDARAETPIERAFRQRQPIEGAVLYLDGAPAVAGRWCVDAQPNFAFEGHFTGYVGRFRRISGDEADVTPSVATASTDGASLCGIFDTFGYVFTPFDAEISFLIDTRSAVSVLPRKFANNSSTSQISLTAANGTKVQTYGNIILSFKLSNLDLCFEWKFLIADVTRPILGADFFSHYKLLVDCHNHKLITS